MSRLVFSALLLGMMSGPHDASAAPPGGDAPRRVGNRRELFVDEFLVDRLVRARRVLHHPRPQNVAIVHDAPWEGNVCYYHTVFRDGDRYRMYYRGMHSGPRAGKKDPGHHEVVCYAESLDGVTFTKPQLGLYAFGGSKANNIIWTGVGTHNFVPFKDTNPDCRPEARYKAVAATHEGIYILRSRDAIRWSLMSDRPVVTDGRFDSQNLAFFDNRRGLYVEYQRGFQHGVRAIMTATSRDFRTWSKPEFLTYGDKRHIHLYTNQIAPYPRAPHILLGFPKRLVPDRNPTKHRYKGVSDILLISSRDGRHFDRTTSPFLAPGRQPARWVNRNNFLAWGLVETQSPLPGVGLELSMYSIEGYYVGDECRMRRHTLRPDGFVSIRADREPGELHTRPIVFSKPPPGTPRVKRDRVSPPVTVETGRPIRGSGSLDLRGNRILEISGTRSLGRQATFAVRARVVPPGVKRLFSTYDGATTRPGELLLDFNSGGTVGNGIPHSIRFDYNGMVVGARFEDVGDWSSRVDPRNAHHIVATWDDGKVVIYFDGREVATGGRPGAGDLVFRRGNLRFGEDYPPTPTDNDRMVGVVDDILVLRRALSPREVSEWSADPDKAAFLKPDAPGILLTADNSLRPFEDRLLGDGQQVVSEVGEAVAGDVELLVNFATSAAGALRVEIQDESGQPIPGFRLEECDEIFGDAIERAVSWKGQCDVSALVGRTVRLRVELREADLYSLRFGR